MISFISSFSFSAFLISTLFSLVLLFLIFFIIIPYRRVKSFESKHVGAPFFPILGFFHRKEPKSQAKKDGDMVTRARELSQMFPGKKALVSNLGTKTVIQLRDSQYLKEFLQNQQNYIKSDFTFILRPLLGNGLVLSEGDVWKRHRRIISATFHYEFLKSNINTIQDVTTEFFNKLTPEELAQYSAINKIQEITGEVVGRIFFGENLNSYIFEGKPLTMALVNLIIELVKAGGSPLIIIFGPEVLKWPIFYKFRRALVKVKKFRSVCEKIISDRKTKNQRTNDLLGALLATQKSEDPSMRFSDEDIIDEFLTFFFAGMDTTGHLIAMVLYNLTQHPQWRQILEDERKKNYNLEERKTADTLQKMDMLHSFIKETLRFHSPVGNVFSRTAIKDHKLLDLNIRKGDIVRGQFFPTFHSEKHYTEPSKFNPERWNANAEQNNDPFAFTPFSSGARNCIGQHLALLETKLIVSEFLERFDYKLKDGYVLKMATRVLHEPKEEMIFVLKPKNE